jgi:parallel beta-helix repeat protein
MRTILVFLTISLATSPASGTSYYLSQNGSDDNPGTEQRLPWRTLGKLQTAISVLKAGDSVLLERGSVFFGEIFLQADGLPGKNVYVGAYGEGPRPIVTGSIALKDWTRYEKNIWMATCLDCPGGPASLFIDGKYHSPGRYPNEGYRTIGKSLNNDRAFSDPALSFPDNFWDGAEVVVKSSPWTLDKLPVYRYVDKTFVLSSRASDTLQSGYGYFIQNHYATLDGNGEWFLNSETHQLFLYADGVLPGKVEVSVSDGGLNIGDSRNIVIENLCFTNQRVVGISVARSSDVVLRNVAISHPGANGLVVINCRNPLVENVRIADAGNNGVEWGNNHNGRFLDNTITRTGLHPGAGASGNGNYIALSIQSSDPRLPNLIANNRIDSVGYIGIDFRGGNTTIKNNFIADFCLLKDDGGGIYTWGNAYGNNIIEGNIVMNGRGSAQGARDPSQLSTSGIYIDDRSAHIDIRANTLAFNATAGIMIHNSNNIRISENRFYANGLNLPNIERGQLIVKRDALVPARPQDPLRVTIMDNVFLSPDEVSACLYMNARKGQSIKNEGTVKENVYLCTSQEQAIAVATEDAMACSGPQTWSVAAWHQQTSLDSGSVFKHVSGTFLQHGKNLVRNSTMTNGTSGWIIWPERAKLTLDNTLSRNPSLKATPPTSGAALLYHSGFSLRPARVYRLRFRARSAGSTDLQVAPLQAVAPWATLGRPTCFSLDTAFHTFTYYFRPEKPSADARMNFTSQATFWIDDVTLEEIADLSENQSHAKLIYNATDTPHIFRIENSYMDLQGNQVCGEILVKGHDSIILFRAE